MSDAIICPRCLQFAERYGCQASGGNRLADGSMFFGPSATWTCRAPIDPPAPPAPERRMTVAQARTHLRKTLGHWKDGTRPGDEPVREVDVMHAIADLVDAMLDHHEARLHPESAAAAARNG